MSDSTSILDLPTDPVGGGNVSNNITMSATENVVPQSGQNQAGFSLDQSTISQIVNGLQQASLTGATQLPSRDIPMTTTGHSTDPQVQPNYVPGFLFSSILFGLLFYTLNKVTNHFGAF